MERRSRMHCVVIPHKSVCPLLPRFRCCTEHIHGPGTCLLLREAFNASALCFQRSSSSWRRKGEVEIRCVLQRAVARQRRRGGAAEAAETARRRCREVAARLVQQERRQMVRVRQIQPGAGQGAVGDRGVQLRRSQRVLFCSFVLSLVAPCLQRTHHEGCALLSLAQRGRSLRLEGSDAFVRCSPASWGLTLTAGAAAQSSFVVAGRLLPRVRGQAGSGLSIGGKQARFFPCLHPRWRSGLDGVRYNLGRRQQRKHLTPMRPAGRKDLRSGLGHTAVVGLPVAGARD